MAEHDLSVLDELGAAIVAAAHRAEEAAPAAVGPRRRGRPLAVLAAAAALLALLAASAAATALVLRSTITEPDARTADPAQTPVAGTGRLAAVRADDPAGGRPWGLRTSRSRPGFLCVTSGQLDGGVLGVTGLDGTFRASPERRADACAQPVPRRASLVGVRVFDAPAHRDVRSVVFAVGDLARAELTVGGRRRALPVRGGAALAVVPGYPEDAGVELDLRLAEGGRQVERFGIEPGLVRDPGGGRAWRAELYGFNGRPAHCVRLSSARPVPPVVSSPSACGRVDRDPFFVAVRRVVPGTRGRDGAPFAWGDHPPRTLVLGRTRSSVRLVTVAVPGRPAQQVVRARGRAFAAVLGADVDPRDVVVELVLADGTVERVRGQANLVEPEDR